MLKIGLLLALMVSCFGLCLFVEPKMTPTITPDSSQVSSNVIRLETECYKELVPYQMSRETLGKSFIHVIELEFRMTTPKYWSLYVQANDKFDMDREAREGEILIGHDTFWDPAIPTERLIYEAHANRNIYVVVGGKQRRWLRFRLPNGRVIPQSGFIKAWTRLVSDD